MIGHRGLALALLISGCASPGPPGEPPRASAPPPASAAAPAIAASSAPVVSATPAPADAGAPTTSADAGDGAADAAIAEAPFDPQNKAKPPSDSEDLQARARGLFDAIVKDDAAAGDPFWFPKEPFIPLKDVKGPDKYWDNLHRAYHADIHKLHRKRKSWDGAVFKRFDLGSTPKWVKPGDEANKIGYFRSLHGKLSYEIEGAPATLDVHTVISWQGRWYVTHLGKFK